jgi:hypothetical protein
MRKTVALIQPGDILLCYLTGVMRWVGVLRVLGPSKDKSRIWSVADFPERLAVEVLIGLAPEQGVPMDQLEGKVAYYRGRADAGKFRGFLRGSPRRFDPPADGEFINSLLHEAKRHPVERPVDQRKLDRKPGFFRAEKKKGRKTVEAVVSVPESAPDAAGEATGSMAPEISERTATQHTEIQYHLLSLGAEMGFDVWVARNDRGRTFKGEALGEMPHMIGELPTQFNEATNRTIELIDVLWVQGNSIVAAFEVESTTSIYSGLLRMSDLLALQPNLDIDLFLVAPEDRREKVEQEILRPTFKLRDKPLSQVCGFIGFQDLITRVEGVRRLGLASSLKPDFLQKMAEYFDQDSDSAR